MGFYYTGMRISLLQVGREASACRRCERILEPRPVFRAGESSRLLIVGQAPGRRVHETGIPWNDP
jgi:uracil-DNA glycosylase